MTLGVEVGHRLSRSPFRRALTDCFAVAGALTCTATAQAQGRGRLIKVGLCAGGHSFCPQSKCSTTLCFCTNCEPETRCARTLLHARHAFISHITPSLPGGAVLRGTQVYILSSRRCRSAMHLLLSPLQTAACNTIPVTILLEVRSSSCKHGFQRAQAASSSRQ